MTVNYSSNFLKQLNPFDVDTRSQRRISRSEWTPPQYTSMFGWYTLNYLLLTCMIALPTLIGYAVWSAL